MASEMTLNRIPGGLSVSHLSTRKRICQIIAIWMVGLAAFCSPALYAADNLPEQFVAETVVTGLVDPVNIVTMPDGRMLVLEKGGRVKMFNPALDQPTTQIILGVGAIQTAGERGLASIALDPDFSNNGYLYLYYTQLGNGNRNRISRFRFDFISELASEELLVWEDNEPVEDCCHFGGGMDFGPDGMLYLATGEEFDGPQAQDLTRAGGKIIRLDTSEIDEFGPWVRGGSNLHIIPEDNPAEIMDGAGPNLDEIWAYGLRNPYRAHWDLVNERFYIGEVGGNVQETATEDLHLGRKGANLGWPLCEGTCNNPAYDDPVYSYFHTGATPLGGAITAGVVYRGELFPEEFNEAFFFADYAVGFIKYLKFDPNGDVESVNDFATNAGPIVALELGADEALYGIDFVFGNVVRYSFDSGNQRPEIQSATVSTSGGPPPLEVTFNGSATDPEDDQLEYRWVFGDGFEATGQTATHTYTTSGLFNAFLVVSDSDGTRTSDIIPIQVGDPPVAVIDFPVDGSLFSAGDLIAFSGTNAGPTGSGPYTFEWDVKFTHNAHVHPGLVATGTTGEFQINTSGHDYHDDTGYEFKLTVTDADGLRSVATSAIVPDKVNLNLNTVPAGFQVTLDGLPVPTPIAYDTLKGFQHVLSVPETFCSSGVQYEFDSWSNGANRTQPVTIPLVDISLTASFNETGACSDVPADGLVAHFEAGQGVETTGAIDEQGNDPISRWLDLSGNDNNFDVVSGDPALAPGVFNGNAVVDFDGFGDALRREAIFEGFPFGDSDRTVFMVANYQGMGPGGFTYGAPRLNGVFGLQLDDTDSLRINGFGESNDFVSTEPGRGVGWLIQSAVVDDNVLTHFENDRIIDVQSHTYNTGVGPMVLGADVDEIPHVDMQVAAILVYNRALSDTERQQVLDYLDGKYFTVDGNRVPVANNDEVGVPNGGTGSFDVLANDDDDGALDPASVEIVSEPTGGTASVNPVNGEIEYTHNGVASTDSLTYTVADTQGVRSSPAIVSISLSSPGDLVTSGLIARYESDSGIQETGGLVTAWLDSSGAGNDLSALADVTIEPDGLNGQPIVVFDGVGDRMERVGNLSGFPAGDEDRTVYFVVNYEGSGYGGFGWGESLANEAFVLGVEPSERGKLMVQGFGAGNDFVTIFDGDEGWIVQSAVLNGETLRHFEDGNLIDIRAHVFNTGNDRIVLGAELDGNPQVPMEVAAILVYDRALNTVEQQRVQNYLQVKYNIEGANNLPPVARDDRFVLVDGGTGEFDVGANDFDPADGSVVPRSVAIVEQPMHGSVSVNSLTGLVTYIHNGGPEDDRFTYTIEDEEGQASLPAEVRVKIGTPASIPLEHNVSRYESDDGIVTVAGNRVDPME